MKVTHDLSYQPKSIGLSVTSGFEKSVQAMGMFYENWDPIMRARGRKNESLTFTVNSPNGSLGKQRKWFVPDTCSSRVIRKYCSIKSE